MPSETSARERAAAFCRRFGLHVPILMAPMAGACPVGLAAAVGNAGGMGGLGALMTAPDGIASWAQQFRAQSNGTFQINLWVPDPPPRRDADHERLVREFLGQWGPPVLPEAGDAAPLDFDAQCAALLAAGPRVVSSIMGLFPDTFVAELKARGIAWFACATTLAEARAAEAAGADAVVAQGLEAGGHRGAFDADAAERQMVGLFALVPRLADKLSVPIIATRGFSGRLGRAIATDYTRTAAQPDAPAPAPYPVQRGLTAPMREAAARAGDVQRMQAWAGQAAALARPEPAGEVVRRLWDEAEALLPGA